MQASHTGVSTAWFRLLMACLVLLLASQTGLAQGSASLSAPEAATEGTSLEDGRLFLAGTASGTITSITYNRDGHATQIVVSDGTTTTTINVTPSAGMTEILTAAKNQQSPVVVDYDDQMYLTEITVN